MSQFMTTTPLFQMRALGSAAERSLPKVNEVLHREFRGGIRFELAEPVPRKDGTGIDWYTENDDQLTQLVKLPGELADQYRARLKSDMDTVARLAQAYEARGDGASRATATTLKNAITFPGDDNIWLAGDPLAGTAAIIVTGWGYELHAPPPGKTGLEIGDRRPSTPFLSAVGLEFDQTPKVPEEPVAAPAATLAAPIERRPRWHSILAWLLSLIILLAMLAIGWLLLPACGLKLPFGGPVLYGWGDGQYCRQVANPKAERNNAATQALLTEIASLEDQLRAFILTCIPAPVEVPRQEPAQTPAVDDHAEEDAKRILGENDIVPGENDTDVSLIWRNTNDLDLFVICPSGQHVPLGSTLCGATHKLDMNLRELTGTPVEHVSWDDKTLAPGHYKVQIRHYRNNPPSPVETPFTVILHRNGKYETFSGTVTTVGETKTVTEFDVP